MSDITSIIENGKLDTIYNDLMFLSNLSVINESQISIVYNFLAINGYTSDIQGLQEITEWIRKLWSSFLRYKTLPKCILDSISEETQHISANYIKYINNNHKEHKQSANDINISEFESFVSYLEIFKLPIVDKLKDILSDVKKHNENDKYTNCDCDVQIISKIYTLSREIDYITDFSLVIRQKIKSQLNKLRLQLEMIPQKPNDSDNFHEFIHEEGICDIVGYIINKLEKICI